MPTSGGRRGWERGWDLGVALRGTPHGGLKRERQGEPQGEFGGWVPLQNKGDPPKEEGLGVGPSGGGFHLCHECSLRPYEKAYYLNSLKSLYFATSHARWSTITWTSEPQILTTSHLLLPSKCFNVGLPSRLGSFGYEQRFVPLSLCPNVLIKLTSPRIENGVIADSHFSSMIYKHRSTQKK